MKKFINLSIIFAVIGMALGVYYREATSLTGFFDTTGATTQLAVTHVHTLVLGTLFLLLYGGLLHMKNKTADDVKRGLIIYLVGVSSVVLMMVLRGSLEVFATNPLSKGLDMAISGIAGVAHIIFAVGFIHLLIDLKKVYSEDEPKQVK